MKAWLKYRSRVIMTIGLMSVWISAIFCLQPDVTPAPLPMVQLSAKEWATTNFVESVVKVAGVTHRIGIPAGFRCDLASLGITDTALGISRDHPSIRRAALTHDYLYRTRILPRETADLILYQICLDDGMEPKKARAVYQAVKVWGGGAWNR